MSNSSNLYRLQHIDSNLDQIYGSLSEIDAKLNDSSELNTAKEHKQETEANYKQAQKALNQIEELVLKQQTKIEQDEASLYSGRIQNPKELQDLQMEIQSLKRYLSTLEDRQLDAMLVVEDCEADFNQATFNVTQTQGKFAESNAHLRAERTSLINQVERLKIERAAAVSSISDDESSLYEQLRQQRNGIAVTRINESSCSACGSTLTPGLIQAVKSSAVLTRCPMCGRILFAG